MTEQQPKDIQEGKAEMEEVAVEDARRGGDSVVTPWLKAEESHAWGVSLTN